MSSPPGRDRSNRERRRRHDEHEAVSRELDHRQHYKRRRRNTSSMEESSSHRRRSRSRSNEGRRHHRRDYKDRRRRSRSRSSSSASEVDEKLTKRLRSIFAETVGLEREVPMDFDTAEMMSRNTIACYDRQRDFEPIKLRRKFFADVKVDDKILCKVVGLSADEVNLKPECTMSRYRRCLYRIAFPPTTVVALCEIEFLACTRGDLICATVQSVDLENLKLYLAVDNYGVPLKTEQLPAYYRKLPELDLDSVPDLEQALGIGTMQTRFSALPELRSSDLDNPRKGPEALRRKLQEVTASKLVEEAAALVREKRNTAGIERFSKALESAPQFVPALVGRGAAFANDKRYEEALADLRFAHSIDSDDATATKYLGTVLLVSGQEAEARDELELALEKYREALEATDDNRARILLSQVRDKIEARRRQDEERRSAKERLKTEKRSRQEQRDNQRKLAEMERFIADLKRK